MTKKWPLTKQEFETIYAKVPRLTVEVLLKGPDGIYLTQRAIEPCVGQWHLPGGTVFFGESLIEAVRRIAKRELGIDITEAKQAGVIEYPSHYKKRSGHTGSADHPVGIVYEVLTYGGKPIHNQEALDAGWFTELPKPTHADQDTFLRLQGYAK